MTLRFRPIIAAALMILLAACQTPPNTLDVSTVTATHTATAALTNTPMPSSTPTLTPTASHTPTITPTPHALYEFTLSAMRARSYPGGAIERLAIVKALPAFTTYNITYPSDGLTITGRLTIPTGDGPFPVIVLNHAYWPRDLYYAGAGVEEAAEFLAERGYLTVSSDYRSWGDAERGLSLFHMGLVTDVLNLVSSVSRLPEADPDRIGMWGHSMGGGITTKVLTIDSRIKAAVLYAPNSADDADLLERWGPGCQAGQTDADFCDPAEVIPYDTPQSLIDAYLAGSNDPAIIREVAPIYHLDWISAPIQIHIGEMDGARLGETPPEWSKKLYDGLIAAGKTADRFVYERQGHFFQGESWTLFMERAADFFDEHVK